MNLLSIVWDPALGIPLGPFTVRYYSLMYVIAFVLGFQIMKMIYQREKVDVKLVDSLFLYVFVAVLVGARLGHVFFYQPELLKEDFFSVFLPFQFIPSFKFTGFQGLASHGAAIGIILSLYIYSKNVLKKNPLWIMDRVISPIALGCGLIRVGNFINSEIVGKPSDLPWAVEFVQQSLSYGEIVPRHPAQLYEAIGYVIIFIVSALLYLKTSIKERTGMLFSIMLGALLLVRILVEFFKEPQGGESGEVLTFLGLNTGQVLSIPLFALCIYVFIKAKK